MLKHLLKSTSAISKRTFSTNAFGSLKDKVAVVVGSGNAGEEWGIGMSTSILFARMGAKVVSVSNIEANTKAVTDAILSEGGDAVGYTADVTKYDDVTGLVNKVMEQYGQADIVVNAGVHNANPNGFAKFNEKLWMDSININCNAQFQLIHQFLPHMQERGIGNFIHYTTIAGSVGLGIGKQRHAYAAGKAAAAVLTKRIGIENAKKGIRGNVIQIGYVAGPLVTRAVANAGADIDAVTAQRDSYVPRGKQGTPMEIANTAVFLASDESSFINGNDIFVDGGGSHCTYGP